MTLRGYQSAAIEQTLAALERSGSAVLQMPTGAGKTKTATEIIANHDGIVWFVCHRREIERQAAKAFREAGIVSPRSKPDYSKRVQIVSVGTLARRVTDLPAPSLVIWDECHHVAAKSWAEIREALTDALHLGLTATPERFDGKGLREWFAELIPGPSIPDLIPEFLSTYSYFAPSSPDLTAARMQAGDYAKGDAAKIMNTPVLIGDAFREYREKADGKRALAFCVTREASRALVERFQAEGVPAVHIDANTKDDEREAAVQDLVAGRVKLISNVEVFTEGVDIPEIDAAILLRPTKSPTLFFQMVGRVLRKAEGKNGAIILDHAGLVRDHGRLNDPWVWSIDGGAAKARRKASSGFRTCPKCTHCPQEREPVCSACGYEYPTGREIGEFDGVLTEIRDEVPEGCETVADFAKRVGSRWGTVWQWVREGLPSSVCGSFVEIEPGVEWINSSTKKVIAPDGVKLESQEVFAARFGMQRKVATRWLKMGAPHVKGKLIIPDAVNWVKGNVDLASASKKSKSLTGRRNPPPGCETFASFAKRHNLAPQTARNYVGMGLLKEVEGFILKADGDDAMLMLHPRLEKNHSSRRLMFHTILNGVEVESGEAFFRRLGLTNWIGYGLVRGGLPYGGRASGIPIREALEWVRDNRPDIAIPPEAWPTADNDNEAATKAA